MNRALFPLTQTETGRFQFFSEIIRKGVDKYNGIRYTYIVDRYNGKRWKERGIWEQIRAP